MIYKSSPTFVKGLKQVYIKLEFGLSKTGPIPSRKFRRLQFTFPVSYWFHRDQCCHFSWIAAKSGNIFSLLTVKFSV